MPAPDTGLPQLPETPGELFDRFEGGRGNPRPLELAPALLIRRGKACQYTGGLSATPVFCNGKCCNCKYLGKRDAVLRDRQPGRVERFSPSNSPRRSRQTCGQGMLRKVAISRQTSTVWPTTQRSRVSTLSTMYSMRQLRVPRYAVRTLIESGSSNRAGARYSMAAWRTTPCTGVRVPPSSWMPR